MQNVYLRCAMYSLLRILSYLLGENLLVCYLPLPCSALRHDYYPTILEAGSAKTRKKSILQVRPFLLPIMHFLHLISEQSHPADNDSNDDRHPQTATSLLATVSRSRRDAGNTRSRSLRSTRWHSDSQGSLCLRLREV